MRKKRQLTAPREQIDWFPTIAAERCTGCNICYEFCFRQVYEAVPDEQRVIVARPYQCVVLCQGCVAKCPVQAISFPDRAAFQHFVRYEEETGR